MPTETAIQKLRPEEAAEAGLQGPRTGQRLARPLCREPRRLSRRVRPRKRASLSANPVRIWSRTIGLWQLSQAKAAALFGVSRQAFAKWLQRGVPADHAVAVADLKAATDLLEHYLKRDRIPAVVRRPIPSAGRSLTLLGPARVAATRGRLLSACRAMFDFERAHR